MCTFMDDVRKLIDKQRSDVQRAFLGLHSPYIVREEYRDRVKATEILDATPEERRRILKSVKVIVDPTRYKQVLSNRTRPMLPCVLFEAEEMSEEDLRCMLEAQRQLLLVLMMALQLLRTLLIWQNNQPKEAKTRVQQWDASRIF